MYFFIAVYTRTVTRALSSRDRPGMLNHKHSIREALFQFPLLHGHIELICSSGLSLNLGCPKEPPKPYPLSPI